MRFHNLRLFFIVYFASAAISSEAEAQVIFADRAAEEWTDAYPVGNGRLGAMPFGQFPVERLLLNEETIWQRGPDRFMPEDSFTHLEKIRELEAAGAYAEADEYFESHLMASVDPYSYQLLGWLELEYLTGSKVMETRRELDLDAGIATTRHTLSDGNLVVQEVFASAPSDCILIRITSEESIGVKLSLDGATADAGELVKLGSGDGHDEQGVQYVGRARFFEPAVMEGGSLLAQSRRTHTIAIAAATNFNRRNGDKRLPDGWQAKARHDLESALEQGYEAVLSAALADHRNYYRRMKLDLGETDSELLELTTQERLERIQEGKTDDPDLVETYVQFGRYLLIASSRPGTLPSNLQGIWNPHPHAPWSSDFHLNINLQMNYWPAETANLSELHQPFIDLIHYLQPRGKDMARRLGMDGWCMGHATDLWGNARIMSSRAYWGGSFFGGQWMTFHILERYRFTRNPDLLLENWEVLTESTRFVASWLIADARTDQLLARPSASPENSFLYEDSDGESRAAALSAGNSFDQYLVLQVFSDYLEAARVLGRDEEDFALEVAELLPRVYRPKVGPDGRLMEWRFPFEEKEPGHRHISHVLGAYPGNQINLDRDQELREAVKKTLDARLEKGGAATGWSRAWTIGMFARLSDGEEAYRNLIEILRRSTADSLLDMHPPFQIDGNFGATAAVMEMLVHSHNGEIRLLPALPGDWSEGSVSGIRARGDYTLNFAWEDSHLVRLEVEFGSNSSSEVTVRVGDRSAKVSGEANKTVSVDLSELR